MVKYIIIALISACLAGIYYYRTLPEISRFRSILLTILRTLSLAFVIVLIISPILYYLIPKKIQPRIVILKDISHSMELSHGKHAKGKGLEPMLSRISRMYEESGYETAAYSFASSLEGGKENSLLLPSVSELITRLREDSDSEIAGFVLASDGWLRDGNLSPIKNLSIPFMVLRDTTRLSNPDLSALDLQANRHTYRNEPTLIKADFKADNWAGKATAVLKVGNTKVAEKPVNLSANSLSSVEFIHRFSNLGFYKLSIEISAPDLTERILSNNSYLSAIEVLSEKEQIAILSDKPGWDNKYIIDALNQNPRWQIKHYNVVSKQLFSGNQSIPSIDRSNLSALIIINNGNLELGSSLLSQVEQIVGAGTNLLYQGLPISELDKLLPISASNIKSQYQGLLSISEQSENVPAFRIDPSEYNRIPPLDYYYVTAKSGTQILANISNPQNSPAIVISQQANRKVAAMAFLNLWRWQMQSPENAYNSLINNVVTWISNKAGNRFQALYNNSFMKGEEIGIKLRVDDDIRRARLDLSPKIDVKDEKENIVFSDFMTLSQGEYGINFNLPKSGNYTFQIFDANSGERTSGRFIVSDSSLEDREYGYNHPLLSWLASETKGKLIDQGSIQTFKPLPVPKKVVTLNRETPIYKKWYFLSLFILIFSLELFLRRRWGLL